MSGKMMQRKKQPNGYSLRPPSGAARWQVAAYLRSRSVSLLAAAVAMAFPIGAARAGGPIQVANVASGTAAFAQAGSVTTITAANNTIINYQKFGIPQGNTVDFIQPSASARVLNRIIGPTPTQIDGTLNANGVVYFVNPAGVMFGAGAVINVGQLYAAAGHMSDADFLSGVNSFTENSGSITNAGVIKAGDVTFAAGHISNNGTILTPEGMVVMAAGKDVYVSKLGSPFLVQVAGTSTVKTGGTQVSNSGTVDAAGGDVAIRAGDMYSLAINTSGTIKAANVSIQAAGADSTVLVSGKIDAANQGAGSTGGTIAVNGGNIGIGVTADAAGNYHNASAALSAQGAHGGGKILISVKPDAASATGYSDASDYDFIGSDAILNASATSTGNGGLVDTSGQVLNVSPGAVILAAGAGGGSAGQWLLDPTNVTITGSTSTATTGFWNAATPPHGTFEPLGTSSGAYTTAGTADTGTIDAALQAGDDVTITTANGSNGGTGSITVSSSIAPTFNFSSATTVSLSLDAANSININSSITSTSTGLVAPMFNVVLNSGESANNSAVTIAAAIGTATGNGVHSVAINPNSGTGVTGGNINISAGGVVTTNGGGQTFNGPVILATNTSLADSNSGTIAFQNTVDATSNGGESLSVNTAGTTTFAGAVGSSKSLASLTVTGPAGINGGTVTTTTGQTYTGAVTLGANTTLTDPVSIDFTSTVTGTGVTLVLDDSGGTSALGGAVNTYSLGITAGTIDLNGGTVTTTTGQTYTGAVTLGSNTTITDPASIDFTSTVTGTGFTLALDDSGGTSALGGAVNTKSLGITAGTIDLNSGTVTTTTGQTYSGAVTLGASPITLTANNSGVAEAITFGGAVNGGDTLNIGSAGSATASNAIFDGSVGGTVNLTALNVSGTTSLGGNVTTTAGQSYLETVGLTTSNITLTGTTLNASPTTGAAFSGAGITLNLNFTGSANLGRVAALGILNSTGTGTDTLNGEISTTGAQNYSGAVTLNSSPITLTANSSGTVQTITFGSTVDGADTLNIGGGGLTSNAVFDGKVGGTTNLAALNVSGATSLGGNVTTTGAQNFLGAVTLNASPITLTANNSGTAEAITFGNTINGADTLSIGGGGLISNAVFDGDVGRTTNLAALNVSGTALLSGNITTTSGQAYDGTLTLNAANITLTDSGVTGITLNSIVATSLDNLAISQTGTGTVSLDGSIANLNNFSVATAGTIILRGNITANDLSISTSSTGGGNPLSVPVAVTINADTQSYAATGTGDTLGSLANLLLADTAGTAAPRSISLTQDATIQDTGLPALTQFTTGVLTGSSYSITSLSGNITLAGGSSTPVSDANLILSAAHGNISLGASGAFTISSLTATSATTGAITLEGNVTTTNGQTYNSAVTLGVGATLTTTNSAVTFASKVDSASGIAEALTVNAGTGTVTFGGAVGAVNPLASLTVDSPTIINGGAVTTTNGQSYHGSVTLGANTTLTDPTFIDVINTVNGSGFSLTLADSGGASTLGSAVTTNSLTIAAGTIALNGGTVTTSNGQNYIGAVTLGANTTLTDPTSIDFANAVSGAGSSLTLADSGGTSTFSGTITTNALHVTAGTIALNGGAVTTSNGENFNGAVTLGANTTLTDPLSIAFLNTVSGPGFFLTLADSGGTSTLAGALNTNSLNITAAAIDLNGATVTTANNQSYNGVVALGSDATLSITNNGAVNFSSTVNAATAGAQFLAVDTGSGTATFGGAVGGTHSLASLTVSGPSIINGGAVTTNGGQSYIGSVTLGANTAIATTNNGGIRFSSSVDALTAGAEGLTLNAGTGTVTFGGAVGGLNSLAALTVSGPTVINGGDVTTTGTQIYDNGVALGADSILATTNSAVNFASTVDSASPTAESLTINAGTGTVTFGGAVGQSHALANLTVTGLTQINGGTVITNGGQSYNSIVALGANAVLAGTTLNSSTTPAVFSGSGDTLTLDFSGNANLGAISTLGSLVTSGPGATTLYGNITTSSAQSYNGTIALAATPITLTGTTLNGSSTPAVFSGSGSSLTLAFSGNADLGAITALGSLADTGLGTTTLYGDITTSGVQSYNGTVSLGAAAIILTGTTLNSSSTPAVFSGSGDTLTLNFSGNANFGAISTLGSLVSSGSGATTLYGDITTSGAQSYNGTIALAATPITLTGTTLNSSSAPVVLSGSGGALILAFSGTADLGTITALNSLADTGSGTTTLYGNITTSGNQTYSSPTGIASALTLTGTSLNPSPNAAAIFSGAGAPALTLDFSRSYNVNLGASSGLASLDLGVPSTVPFNILTSTTLSYPLTVAGTVTVGQSGDPAGSVITLTGSAFTFKSSFDAASPNDGVVFAALSGTPSNVEFDGVVGGSSANPDLASLTVQGTATVNGGAVNTVNSQIYDGGVTINGGGTTTFTSTQGGIAENGGISDTAGGITLSPDSALMVPNPDPILGAGATTGDFRPQNYLTLNGNITASGTVTLAPNAPSFNNVNNPVPDAATIITTVQSGTVTIAGTNIYMGMGQKWTSLTSLTLNANAAGGANVAALGDLNVAGTLTVRANTIDMLLRPAGSQLVPGSSSGVLGLHVNTPGSEGVDIVANSLNLTGSIVPVGAVTDYAPQFAYGPGGTVTGSITPNSPGVHYYGVNVVPSTLMASGIADGRLTTYYLDLKASGPSTSNVTVAVAPILPPPPPQFNSVVVLSSEQRQILREAGINARNTSIDNILNLFGGKAVFNDIPTSDGMIIVHPTLLDYYVTTSRLPYQQTREFIAMYRDLFLAPVIDPKTHEPELDQRGNPVYRSRRMELHVLFRDSYNDYSKAVGAAHATPLGFRTWLEKTPGQAKVLSTLNQLRTLMRQVRVLGLTSVELRLSHSTILAELNPGALSERQFEETVMGHRLSKL